MIYLIKPVDSGNLNNERLDYVLKEVLAKYEYREVNCAKEFAQMDFKNKRILFAIDIGHSGINIEYSKMLQHIREHRDFFKDSYGSVIVDGQSEFFTKNIARGFVFSANMAGCEFPGRPLVEATGALKNFNLQAQIDETDNLTAYVKASSDLVEKLVNYKTPKVKGRKPKILVIHSSNFKTSNTLLLWDMIKNNIEDDCEIKEASLANGTITDCRGCPHSTCMHFSELNSCYYGGQIVKEIYPAVLECDGIVMVSPNYNDAVGANITAFINRLTSLFKTHKFYDKKLFAVVVSGYSGGDLVAQQLVSAVNMNKTFTLPPYFAICETANNVKEILTCDDIVEKSRSFAKNLLLSFN